MHQQMQKLWVCFLEGDVQDLFQTLSTFNSTSHWEHSLIHNGKVFAILILVVEQLLRADFHQVGVESPENEAPQWYGVIIFCSSNL